MTAPLRVLCVARNFPNNVFPRLGLWTERLVRSVSPGADTTVIAPVPYWPPLPGPRAYTRFRDVAVERRDQGIVVVHPRFIAGPGSWLQVAEAWPYALSVSRAADRVRRAFPFDLIHAHFVHPDGWVAARLARRYGVPLVITEQASWRPWLDAHPVIRRRALDAAAQSTFVVAVSHALRDTIAGFIGDSDKLRVIPNVVDGSVFTLPVGDAAPARTGVLFVGLIRHVKGLDVLLRALRLLLDRGRPVRVSVVGESFYESYRRDYDALRRLVVDLRLGDAVQFVGSKTPAEVAVAMQSAAVLVLPSRRETFGAVLAEALACGTPVVATRCGGTEDIVTDGMGVLVPTEDPESLARAIATVLDGRQRYDPAVLRASAIERFGIESVGRQMLDLYREAMIRRGRP